MDKSKPIWIIGNDKEICDDLLQRLAYIFSHWKQFDDDPKGHMPLSCPPRKERCGKVYDRGCTECWEEWFAQNVEVVHDE